MHGPQSRTGDGRKLSGRDSTYSRRVEIAALALNFIGPSTFLVLPALVEGTVHTLAFSDRQVGLMSSVLSCGTLVSALSSGAWVRRVSWTRVALFALIGLVASDSLALVFHSLPVFLVLQGLVGFFGGCLGCLAMTILSDSRDPARSFGLAMAVQVTYQFAGILAGPKLLAWAGVNGVLAMLAVLAGLALPLVPLLPSRGREVISTGVAAALARPATLLALSGCMMFFVNVGAYWTYVEIIGRDHALSVEFIANAIAGGVFAGIPGGLVAMLFGDRLGRIWPLAIAALLTAVSVLLLRGSPGAAVFVVSSVLYNFAWNYSLPYQLAAVNSVDASGRAVAIAGAFYMGGASSGAAVAGLLVGPHDYGAVIWLVTVTVLLSTTLFAVSTVAHRRGGALVNGGAIE